MSEIQKALAPIVREKLAEVIWNVDGPVYSGWPSGGERVYFGYHDQYPGEWRRCLLIADAVLDALHPNGKSRPRADVGSPPDERGEA